MPRRSSSSESDRVSSRKRRDRKRSSSPDSTNSESSRSRNKKSSRHASRSRSRTPPRGSRNSRRNNRSRSKSPRRRTRRSRSSSRTRSTRQSRSPSNSRTGHRRTHKARSRSGSRSDSRSSKNKKSNKRQSKSVSPSRSKHQTKHPQHEKEIDPLKQKVLQAAKAAAIADAELREKGLLKETPETKILSASISEQLQRAQALDEINAPSFVQHRFTSSKNPTKPSTKGTDDAFDRDAHMAAIFGLAAPKLGVNPVSVDASIKKLETWKENPEMLVHESLLVDQVGKQERWLKKLLVMRRKKLSEEP